MPVELRRFDGMIHNFVTLPEVFDDADAAREWGVRLRRPDLTEGVRALREKRRPDEPVVGVLERVS